MLKPPHLPHPRWWRDEKCINQECSQSRSTDNKTAGIVPFGVELRHAKPLPLSTRQCWKFVGKCRMLNRHVLTFSDMHDSTRHQIDIFQQPVAFASGAEIHPFFMCENNPEHIALAFSMAQRLLHGANSAGRNNAETCKKSGVPSLARHSQQSQSTLVCCSMVLGLSFCWQCHQRKHSKQRVGVTSTNLPFSSVSRSKVGTHRRPRDRKSTQS